LLEIVERLGKRREMYTYLNAIFDIKGDFALDPSEKYTWEEIVDRRYKSVYGEKHGLDYFKQHDGLLKWPKKAEETYWRPFIKARSPIYYEHFKSVGEKIKKIVDEYDLPDFDLEDFQPLPDWKPCNSHEEKRPDFDLFAHYYRVPLHTFTSSGNNPWISDASELDPYVYQICLNTGTGKRKGIKEGDWIEMESSATGEKVEGKCRLVEGIHPELVAISGCGGHWSAFLPVASKARKGANPMWLIPLSIGNTDPVGLNQDLCVRVRIKKVRGPKK
jgi:molybdopterin-containing oxidoreductase family molybdopterin binding subunit